ncbi:hypothetical protein GCM10010145_34490 [Streptomyces ruber]|uniref:Uncharacterized protein n=2 Tax=Streptomyces TaxID=1883 RepID=A0A918ET66_9ACTN|nr:hypothetical protein GCM10010145_34490 [Streptomyces ruber]
MPAAADALSVQVMPRRQGPVPPLPDRGVALPDRGVALPDRGVALLAGTTVRGETAQPGSRRVGDWLGGAGEGGDGQTGSLRAVPLSNVFTGMRGDPSAEVARHGRSPHAAGLVRAFTAGQEGAAAIVPTGRGLPTGLRVRVPRRQDARAGRLGSRPAALVGGSAGGLGGRVPYG